MKLLAELLSLDEEPKDMFAGVDGLVSAAQSGYNKAKETHEKKKSDAEAAQKQADENVKINLKDDLNDFVDSFFAKFPLRDDAAVAELLKKYPTLESAKEAFKAFKATAERIDQLRSGFNLSLIKSRKIGKDVIVRYQREAKAHVGPPVKPFNREFIRFVKQESKFFKRLIQVDDDFKLDDAQFKEMLALKVKQTDPARIPDVAQYLNILFMYATSRLMTHTETIRQVGKSLNDEKLDKERAARDAARNTK